MVRTRAAVRRSTPSILLTIPPEILLSIADYLDDRVLLRLLRTNKHIYAYLAPYFYRRIVNDGESDHFVNWAAAGGFQRTFEAMIAQGASITAKRSKGLLRTPLLAAILGIEDRSSVRTDYSFEVATSNDVPEFYAKRYIRCISEVKERRKRIKVSPPRTKEEMRKGRETIIRLLLAHPDIDVTTVDAQSQSVFHIASQSEFPVSTETLRLLADAGAPLEARNDAGFSPLLWACRRPHPRLHNVVRVLLTAGADCVATRTKDRDRWPERLHSCLHYAAQGGDHVLTQILLTHGRNIKEILNERDSLLRTPLYLSCHVGSHRVTYELLKAGASITIEDNLHRQPIHTAVSGDDWNAIPRDRVALVRMLLHYGGENLINARGMRGRTPLHLAASRSYKPRYHTNLLRYMIQKGADIHAEDDYGETPLHLAAGNRQNSEAIRILLDAGADSDINSDALLGRTPLLMACQVGEDDPQNVTTLLEAGADVDSGRYYHKGNALMVAAKNGYAKIVRALLDGGADPSYVDRKGRTALHSAAKAGRASVVEVLCASDGVDTWAEDDKGQQALQLAGGRASKKEAIIKLLDARMSEQEEQELDEEATEEGARAMLMGLGVLWMMDHHIPSALCMEMINSAFRLDR